MLSLIRTVSCQDERRSIMFAKVEGAQRRLWLKNSLNVSGANVRASAPAQ